MGCNTSSPQARRELKVPTLIGGVHVTVQDSHLSNDANDIAIFDSYVKIIVSNQAASTQVKKQGSLEVNYDETLVIPINSCYKPFGRSMQVFILQRNQSVMDKLLAYGIIDLDFMLKRGQPPSKYKCTVSNETHQIGYINLLIQFVQQPYETIAFKFESLELIEKTMLSCWVKMIVGEEVLQTPKLSLNSEIKPVWNDQTYEIEVPTCVKTASLEVFEGKKMIGLTKIDLTTLDQMSKEKLFKQRIKTKEGIQTGGLVFSITRVKRTEVEEFKKMPDSVNQMENYEKWRIKQAEKQPIKQKKAEKSEEQFHRQMFNLNFGTEQAQKPYPWQTTQNKEEEEGADSDEQA